VTLQSAPQSASYSAPHAASTLPWRLEDLPFDRIDHARIRDREDMMVLLVASSFVEFASDTYAGNLADFTADQPDIAEWLSTHWEPEEMQHGRALRSYIRAVWPEFDWDAAYATFFEEYRALCGVEGYAASRGLEMAARCIVETGTSTLYRAIRDLADEPVLVQLVEKIRSDEVRHYKHFLQYFDRYDGVEKNGRLRVMGVLKARLVEAIGSDGEVGMWHAYRFLHPGELRDGPRYRALQSRIARMVRSRYPAVQALKMILKPLRLSNFAAAIVQPLLAPIALLLRQVLLR
jgi:rubrerythrin